MHYYIDYEITKRCLDLGYSINKIAELFGIYPQVLQSFCKKNNLKSNAKFIWTKEKEEQLKIFYEESVLTIEEIAKYFNTTSDSIANKAKALKIKKSKRVKKGTYIWTDERISFLKKCYEENTMTIKQIASKLGTTSSIVSKKAKKLGLKKDVKAVYADILTTEDKLFILENYPTLTITQLSEELQYDKGTIQKFLRLNDKKRWTKEDQLTLIDGFEDDIKNPAYSTAYLSRKYNVSEYIIYKIRKKRFPDFKSMVDTFLCKTTAELNLEEILNELDLTFFYEYKINKWKVDYYLGQKNIIEVYGTYWHNKEDVKNRDERKNNELKELGYNIIIIKEEELKDKDKIKNQILTRLKGLLIQ